MAKMDDDQPGKREILICSGKQFNKKSKTIQLVGSFQSL